MPAILESLVDGPYPELHCFASVEDAERFKKFANIYMDESGAGNGYGAYWVFTDLPIMPVKKVPRGKINQLKENLLLAMMKRIVIARTATRKPDRLPTITLGLDKGITFATEELPPRQRPTVGDMFRTLESEGATKKLEGRVLIDNGETLVVIEHCDEKENGQPNVKAKRITLPAKQVMKINDWLAEYRQPRVK